MSEAQKSEFIIRIPLNEYNLLYLSAVKFTLKPKSDSSINRDYLFTTKTLKQLIDGCLRLRISDLAGNDQNEFRDNTLNLYDFVQFLENEMLKIDTSYKKQMPELPK